MPSVNISLPEQLKEFVDAQISSGHYESVSEYFQALIRRDEKHKADERLRALADARERRASERKEIAMPIEVGGTDALGFAFFERTQTLVVSRHGGKIGLERKLVPQQELTIRCLSTGREAEAEVVGDLGKSGKSYHYGIHFLHDDANIWGIDFKPLAQSEGGRVWLECNGCHQPEWICLDELELQVLETKGQLSRACNRCRDVSFWQKSRQAIPTAAIADSAPPAPVAPQDRRREPRRPMRVTACVRSARLGEDLVQSRNTSRSGLCFASPWEYAVGESIEVAIPYSLKGSNIFMPAKIVRVQAAPSEGKRMYGVAYQ